MDRQADESELALPSRRPSPGPLFLTALLISTSLLLGCETPPSADPEAAAEAAGSPAAPEPVPDDKETARIKPYVEEAGTPSRYSGSTVPFGSLALAAGRLLGGAAQGVADLMDPSHVGRSVFIYEVDGKEESYLGRDALLPPGPRRLGVKHCTSGARKVYCSRLVTLAFEAEAGKVYDLLLLGRKKIIIRDTETELPVAWGDVDAITAEAYQNCVAEAEIRSRRQQAREIEDGYRDEGSLESARKACRETHPASYQQSLAH